MANPMLVTKDLRIQLFHDDVIKRKHFPRYWPFVWGIHRSPVNSPHKGQWYGALMFSLICVWINSWANNREAGDLRRYRVHYDVSVMFVQGHNQLDCYSFMLISSELQTRSLALIIVFISDTKNLGCLTVLFLDVHYKFTNDMLVMTALRPKFEFNTRWRPRISDSPFSF